MQLATRKVLDYSFSGLSVFSVALVAAALVVLLAPIVWHGSGAFFFRGTVEHRRLMLENFGRGDRDAVAAEVAAAAQARAPVYAAIAEYERQENLPPETSPSYPQELHEFKDSLRQLLGPFPDEPEPVMLPEQYGETRWDRAEISLEHVLNTLQYDYSDPTKMGTEVLAPRARLFQETSLEPIFAYIESHATEMLQPRWTFYWRFVFDKPADATHFFGGIWPEMLGTLYLTIGAILFAVPMGVASAIYLVEYARENWLVGALRSCISTLAGVPSIVFGLFGLAFFINGIHVSRSRSVLAGSLTLALLILPLIIRSAEEAIRAVPRTYKEAALSLGSGKWRTIVTVILPAALPGILTGIVISMGRAAGETAPIIFTAAVSSGHALTLSQTLTEGTPALPWNIYNLATEHARGEEIRHVRYGMVLTLVMLVLLLNGAAIVLRARISRKLSG